MHRSFPLTSCARVVMELEAHMVVIGSWSLGLAYCLRVLVLKGAMELMSGAFHFNSPYNASTIRTRISVGIYMRHMKQDPMFSSSFFFFLSLSRVRLEYMFL
ncbi:hypothetical protein M758_5G096800 [Ceratodon purpureus]|nr:hypothetical protein M758_5G096800 [Ceratodon purpureus]